MSDALIRRLYEWGHARQARLIAKRVRDEFHCTETERGDIDTGYPGVPACYRHMALVDDYCEACKSREPHFQEMLRLKREERAAFRRLCYAMETICVKGETSSGETK